MPHPLFFFHDTTTTEIYTLSLHDALPIYVGETDVGDQKVDLRFGPRHFESFGCGGAFQNAVSEFFERSEEHTSELQSRRDLVCRLLLEKKKNRTALALR